MLKTEMENYDVVIIGAGPIGLACAIACTKRKLSYVVIEKGALVNSLFNYPLNMTFFSTSERLEIGDVPFISHNPKPTRDEALEYYRRVALHWRVNLRLFERVLSVTPFESEKVKEEVRSLAPNFAPLPSSSPLSTRVNEFTLENDFVLAMTGYQPDFTFLRSMGVELDPTDGLNIPVHNRETMETNVPGVFLAGVICGGMQTNKWFIENSRVHADMVAETIAGRRQNSL
jgi:thioredoxin reductase